MTRPTKEQIETLAAWVHWKKRESGLSESDRDFIQAVSAILEESATLRHEFKMLQAGAKRQRDALRAAREALLLYNQLIVLYNQLIDSGWLCRDTSKDHESDEALQQIAEVLKQVEAVLKLKPAYAAHEEINKYLGEK